MTKKDGVSVDMMDFLNTLSPEEREQMVEMLKHPKTFIAGDVDDLFAILEQLKDTH